MKREMKISPLRNYPLPRYPTQMDILRDPALLRALPVRWSARPAVCIALLLSLSSGLFGCSLATQDSPSETTTEGTTLGPTPRPTLNQTIPVFIHGDGRGAYGCVSVTRPVFMSEDEAAYIIRDEAEKRGVHFTAKRSVDSIEFPATNLAPHSLESTRMEKTWQGIIELDGYDPTLNIGYEFVSTDDIIAWADSRGCSVEEYDMKDTAERLAKVVLNTAVFYDPGERTENNIAIDRTEDLRRQVRDFLDWLAGQGII
jgi:hypothetical protein